MTFENLNLHSKTTDGPERAAREWEPHAVLRRGGTGGRLLGAANTDGERSGLREEGS